VDTPEHDLQQESGNPVGQHREESPGKITHKKARRCSKIGRARLKSKRRASTLAQRITVPDIRQESRAL
jgi:hypothetical protein